jgi:murein DD-endopeptidase MepM/ murein hydrolase activator NlpD
MGSRIKVQQASYKDLASMVKNKEKLLAATPAIQPVSNADLKRIASGFGYRIDPVYKTVKLHPGLDFSAPAGTPIYATADGTVEFAGNRGDGYGNNIIINHGYGYKTLYGHMYKSQNRGESKTWRSNWVCGKHWQEHRPSLSLRSDQKWK